MKRDLISVIVPVHNGQDYLENCIESIAGQSYDNLEILIVNDGSTDRTGEICAGLQDRYENVVVFTLEDLGVSAARNYAMDRAKGAFLTFVDADDRLCPDTLSYLHERITATDSDLAGCRFHIWGTAQEWENICRSMEPKSAALPAEKITFLAENADGQKQEAFAEQCYDRRQYLAESILKDNCRCWSKLYRRRLVDQVRFREGLTVGEDMLFLVDLLPFLESAVETAYPGYGYYQNPAGVMQRPFTPSYMDQVRCWETAGDLILQMDEELKPQTASKIITAVMLTVGKIALCSAKERRQAGEYVRQCRGKLKEQLQIPGSLSYLPGGYSMKARLFCGLPGFYIWLYHGLCRFKRMLKQMQDRRR